MRFAIYCRVSKQDQDPENQRIKLVEFAERQGWSYNIYIEQESTRKTRPIKAKVLNALRRREFDGVIVWKLDRWGRTAQELLLEIEELHKKGIIFISFTDSIDLSTATGKLQFHILSAFAEFERNLIRERTLQGLARVKAKGGTLGRPPGRKDKKPRKRSCYKKNAL